MEKNVTHVANKPVEPFSNDTNDTNTSEEPLAGKIGELREFITREEKALRKVCYKSLKSKFSESFISKCIESGLLIKRGDGSYCWGG
jgi:hypothetical protein